MSVMKKVVTAICLIMLALPIAGMAQQGVTEKDMGAYLFTYFSDPTHSLFMAISYDGYTFTPVNDGAPIIAGDSIAQQHGIRDPHIYRAPNGKFYIAMTDLHVFGRERGYRTTQWERPEKYGWGNNRGLVLMASDDLIHWTHHVARIDRLFPERFGELGCAWAPQTIWDPAVGKPMVYFTIRQKPGGRTKMYYSYANESFTRLETEPQLLFEYPDTTIQVLDADICPMPDGRYIMTYVAQENPGGIKYMISDRINHFDDYHAEQIDAERSGCEAPNMWKRIGQDKWVLMYDIYSVRPHNFGFVETSDFKTFTPLGHFNEGVMKLANFTSPKHGSVIHITKAEAERLERYWREQPHAAQPVRTHSLQDNLILRTRDSLFFKTDEARRIGDQLLLFQRVTGGWPKNINMVKPLTDEEVEVVQASKLRQDDSTIDNHATIMQMAFLARLFQQTRDERYKVAFCQAVEYLLSGQYDNGGWPQFWPQNKGYQVHITYNDNAMMNVMKLLRDVRQQASPYDATLVDEPLRQRCEQAFSKGIECILRTQIVVDGEPTVWCQQHDHETLQPAKARAYELPSFVSHESATIVSFLMQLSYSDERIVRAVNGAMKWFAAHRLKADHPLWARFYDLQEGLPLFCDRDGQPRRSLQEISYERRNGYDWYSNSPAALFEQYEKWKARSRR